MDIGLLKTLLVSGDTGFWTLLSSLSRSKCDFEELFLLSALRKKAHARHLAKPVIDKRTKLAILGGYSLYPLHELVEHLGEVEGHPVELWQGDYDNYMAEIMDDESDLYQFAPEVIFLLPAERRCVYTGRLSDSRELVHAEVMRTVESLLELARMAHEKTGAEIIMTNFMLPARHDLGALRARAPGSDWSFRKWVNLELGLNAPPYLHICDMEFLASRGGGLAARDERSWFESKQPCSPAFMVDLAREVTHLIASLKRAPKKVLVLDLDNTLWGGVVAEDGLEGIELGDTSPRGEAFKAFQKYIASLTQRGVLLAVCSKNDFAKAAEPFEKHPDMVLKMDDIVCFKANWEAKSENIRAIAQELNLGLDSFVFVDDNPAEVEIVRQFAPEVATVLLGPDPSDYVAYLADSRFFEPRSITSEDASRTSQYRSDVQRKTLEATVTDMGSYLESLEMEAVISEFAPVDVPRLSQLINKSNQFNLTTRRRSEADVIAVMNDPNFVGYSVRLKDRFGDHGLISIVIGKAAADKMEIDTWLMSCRVLKRQVEEEVLNELVRLAKGRGGQKLEGVYLPTVKNEMVRDFYGRMGFNLIEDAPTRRTYELTLENYSPITTKIRIARRAYEPN
jgi:FkbH-like protein